MKAIKRPRLIDKGPCCGGRKTVEYVLDKIKKTL